MRLGRIRTPTLSIVQSALFYQTEAYRTYEEANITGKRRGTVVNWSHKVKTNKTRDVMAGKYDTANYGKHVRLCLNPMLINQKQWNGAEH